VVNLERVSFLSPCLIGSNLPCRYQGKTVYLYLRIIESMIEGRPFLYQTRTGTVYHVAENGVDAVQSWSSDEPIVAFVDGDKRDYEPDEIIQRRSVQIVVASFPSGINKRWMKQISGSFFTELVVKLWSPRELLLTGLVLALLSSLD
jgi:hypothetical protein